MFSVSYERANGRFNVAKLVHGRAESIRTLFNPHNTQLNKDWMIQCIIRRHRTMKTGKITNHFMQTPFDFQLSLVKEKNIDQIYGVYTADVFVESTQHPTFAAVSILLMLIPWSSLLLWEENFMLQQLNLIFFWWKKTKNSSGWEKNVLLIVESRWVFSWVVSLIFNIENEPNKLFHLPFHFTFRMSRYVWNFLPPFEDDVETMLEYESSVLATARKNEWNLIM